MRTARRRMSGGLALLLVSALIAVTLGSPANSSSPLRVHAAERGIYFGAAIAPDRLNTPQYSNLAGSEFNQITAENAMKWESLQPSPGQFTWGGADQIVAFAQQNNQRVYGHTLVWHSQTPSWVQNLGATDMRNAMQDHITTVMQRYSNDVPIWDVANEVIDDNAQLRQSFWLNTLGEGYIADAFRFARAADPSAELCLNDYSIDAINAKSTAYYNLVQQLQAQNVPITCMGFQAHLILNQVPGDMQQNLQRFANLGLDIYITELDIRMQLNGQQPTPAQLQQQASDYAAVVNACLNVSRCRAITTWGVHDASSWVPDFFEGQGAPLLWDDNYQQKPAYTAVHDTLAGGNQQPPAAPSGLSAANVTTGSVALSWSPSAGASSYLVERAPGASGGSFAQVGTASGTSFTDSGLAADTTYRYRVSASNSAGTSSPSNVVTVTTSSNGGGGGCAAVGTLQNEWNGGYVMQPVTVTNSGSGAIGGWTVTFTLPAGHTVVGSWNAQFATSGSQVTATNMGYNGALPGGGSTTFGFQINRSSGDSQTAAGYSCSVS